MSSALRFGIGSLFLLGLLPLLAPAHGEDAVRPVHVEETIRPTAAGGTAHACLDQRERHAEAGKVIQLAAAMRAARTRMPGTVVRAKLCHGPDGLVYVLTVLARDGKVAHLTVDAVKGTLVGGLEHDPEKGGPISR
jgi:uncharacterized membrane protein YkoI